MDKDILEKYIDGGLPESQAKEVLDRLEHDDEFRAMFFRMSADKAFASMPYRFDSSDIFGKTILPHVSGNGRKAPGGFIRKVLKAAVAVAAILFIPLCLYFFIDLKERHDGLLSQQDRDMFHQFENKDAIVTQVTNPGVKGVVELPDGSKVWLNSCSEISFPARFDSTERVVRLSGEAYFNVVKDPSRPMYIECKNDLTVKVTGTEFNLTSYDDENSFRILLVSGKVSVEDRARGKVFAVEPSQQLTLSADTKEKPVKTLPDIESKTAWKEGRLVFDNTDMPEVIRRLERWFGIHIVVKDSAIMDYRFTATFGSESVTRVFDILELSSSFGYTIQDNTVILGE